MIRAALLLGACLVWPAVTAAQDPAPPLPIPEDPIGPFVVDARGTLARFKALPAVAGTLGVEAADLPTRGLGLVVGGHFYPWRSQSWALGVGGELLLRAHGSRTVEPEIEDGPDGPTVVTRMTAVSPQVSLNFGRRVGYSYLSGGLGWASLTSEIESSVPSDTGTRRQTINYGGGARWFTRKHLAFSLDLRFYAVRPQEETDDRPGFPRMTVMVFSAGISGR
ncbi:hypothetical protein BH24ACI5_BH24ACI5_05320 [soil metagenome]